MIFLSVAMYCEASPFISHYGLKKDNESTRFQVFKNEKIILIITGTGIMSSAIGVSYLLTKYNAQHSDLFFNIGVCGCIDESIEEGTIMLPHKIINADTKRIFYPDMFFRHDFKEGILETFSKIVTKDMYSYVEGDIIDMEGASAFETASIFLLSHQIYCIKIVSDFLKTEQLSQQFISKIIKNDLQYIVSWINKINEVCSKNSPILLDEDKEMLRIISENLKLSTAMKYQFKQLALYNKIRIGNINGFINPFLDIKCKSKNEGKIYFAKLKEKFMEF